jgi:hypothetical protein
VEFAKFQVVRSLETSHNFRIAESLLSIFMQSPWDGFPTFSGRHPILNIKTPQIIDKSSNRFYLYFLEKMNFYQSFHIFTS